MFVILLMDINGYRQIFEGTLFRYCYVSFFKLIFKKFRATCYKISIDQKHIVPYE